MKKQQQRRDPSSCWSKAREDEDMFVLLGRDMATPATIRFWVNERIALGKNTPTDPQILEALNLAEAIEKAQKR